MDDVIKYVEERLHEWAEWFSQGNQIGIGFSSCSLVYRMMTEGIVQREIGPAVLPSHKEAEEIEGYLREMSEHNQLLADVIRHHYLSKGSLYKKSDAFRVSRTQFKNYLNMGLYWIAGRCSKKPK